MNQLIELAKNNVIKLAFVAKQNSPELLMLLGAVGTVTAAVLACKATLDVPDILNETNEDIEELKGKLEEEKEYTEKQYQSDLTKVYVKTGVKFVKIYAGPVILGTLSLGSVFASNHIMRQRNTSLAAAYATLDATFKRYRKNVVNEYGEEVDFALRHNLRKETVDEVVIDENGKEQTVKKEVFVCDIDENGYSDYARFFDEGCKEWEKNPEYNLFFLKCKEKELTAKLQSRGWMFLNEVYRELGIPETEAGQSVGWIYDLKHPNGDNKIDFGIYEIRRTSKNRDFVNGYENVILLDFNVDGDISHVFRKNDIQRVQRADIL